MIAAANVNPNRLASRQNRSADFQSAVSQNFILRSAASSRAFEPIRSPAERNPAIHQIENLRYSVAA